MLRICSDILYRARKEVVEENGERERWREKKSWEELVPALAESGKSHYAVRRNLQIFIFMTGQMRHKVFIPCREGGRGARSLAKFFDIYTLY